MQFVRNHMEYIENEIAQVDSVIDSMVKKHDGLIALLCTVPGINRKSAITSISEISDDMSQFGSSKRLCCWAGLTPGNNESASKKESVRITRAGVYLKLALIEIAHAAIKSKESPYYRIKYEKIMKRRGKKRAIIAIVRMILIAIFQMLSTGEIWNPTDLCKVDMPDDLKQKQVQKQINQAFAFFNYKEYLLLKLFFVFYYPKKFFY